MHEGKKEIETENIFMVIQTKAKEVARENKKEGMVQMKQKLKLSSMLGSANKNFCEGAKNE